MRGYGSGKGGPKPLDETDIQIIAALSLGMTHEQAGAFVATVQFPHGVTGRTVRNRMAEKSELYDRNVLKIASRFTAAKEEFRQITRAELKSALEGMRHKAAVVKDKVLDHALANPSDTAALSLGEKAAESIIDRDLGRPKQVHEVSGEIEHNLRVWGHPQPAALLERQDRDMEESAKLLTALPGDVFEAEVVQ